MAKKVGELFVELVVDAASGNLSVRQLVSALGELDVVSAGSVGIIGKVGETLYGMAKAATDTATELTALHELTGADPKIVQQWEHAAERITHHTGVVVRGIQAVQAINKSLSKGGGAPPELTGLLGLSPFKTDAKGNTVPKDFFDYMKEIAAPGSRYRQLSREQQQVGAGVFGDADNIYRLIKANLAGELHLEKTDGMSDKQVRDLEKVRSQEIEIAQKLDDIFQKMLTGGGDLAKVLKSISDSLGVIDKWMGSEQASRVWKDTKAGVRAMASSPMNPLGVVGDLLNAGGIAAGAIEAHANRQLREQNREGMGDLRGKLDISLTQNGKSLGTKTAWIDRAGTMRDFWTVADQLGNTP